MIMVPSIFLYTMSIIMLQCECLDLIDVPLDTDNYGAKNKTERQVSQVLYEPYTTTKQMRRYWLLKESPNDQKYMKTTNYEDEKDGNIKHKIYALVKQTFENTKKKMRHIESLKEDHRNQAPYRAGFILAMLKKSKDVIDELFNVAIKHREEWKSLEQLKIFELIVHTNVDATNLLRQLVDVHISHMLNKGVDSNDNDKNKVILL